MRAGAATTVSVGLVITSCIVAGLVHASRREDPPTSPVAGQEEAASSTSNDTRENELTDESLALSHKIFGGRLLEIAAEYRDYERVDQTIRWSPNLCRLPPRLPESMGAISASDSEETHGRKLYYLYARKPWQYKANVWSIGDDEAVDGRAPLGQVLVKEAWHPEKLDAEAAIKLEKELPSSKVADAQEPKAKKAFAKAGEKFYVAGEKKGLFIMFKTAEDTPGTDRGWVYGTVSPDGTKVGSVGRVDNCMQCHQDAPFDRQIGLSRTDLLAK